MHFDPRLPLILATDANPYGVGAVLSHRYPDGTERVLQYASQTLTNTQRMVAQIDKEAYAIIFGIKKFHQYLYSNKFTLLRTIDLLYKFFRLQKHCPLIQHYICNTMRYFYKVILSISNTKIRNNTIMQIVHHVYPFR